KGVFRQELILKEYHFQMFINKTSNKNENYIILFNDISELKKAEMLKSDMVRMLSHEIKNPVNNISIVTENVMDFATTDFLKKNFQILQESTNTIFNIINDFLSLNKLESTLTQLNLTEINIIELLIESIELQSVNANNKNIKILLECEYQKINIHVDKKLILILFNNLILNALKYSYDNSTITVKVLSLEDKVQILVIDNGIGIPGHELNKIFNKFYRASNNSEINVSGTGLGLSIVKKIASMHNGLIEVESEYKKGTTFTFTLLKN
ncbi:MAG: HAMP domain-containing sensor histidine kinase, partial [Cyanobacteriota bacterium]